MLALYLIALPALATDVLFVGNSYTSYNDLSRRVADVFSAAGSGASTDKLTGGGLTLADHATRAADTGTAWHTKLVTEATSRQWVILQDQSQVPGFPDSETMWIASRDGGIALNNLVVDAGAETMFFLTWGRLSGDSMNDWLYPDFSTMQERLNDGYLAYAAATTTAERPVWIAPVGPAFKKIHDDVLAAGMEPTASGNDFHSLYSGDGSHPSAQGSQLAAYVFYASLTGETPVGLPAPDGIDDETARTLQDAAASVVFDDTDAFSFPWEVDEVTDSGGPVDDPDTAVPDEDDSGVADADGGPEVGDSGTEDTSEPEGLDEEVGSTTGSTAGDDKESSGCSAQRSRPTFFVFLLGVLGLALRLSVPKDEQ